MSLEFGLTITLLGALSMLSALALIAITCEILKRLFKKEETVSTQAEMPVKEAPLIGGEMSREEEAAIAAAIAAYMSETPLSRGLVAIPERGARVAIWSMAGRMESMDRLIRREW